MNDKFIDNKINKLDDNKIAQDYLEYHEKLKKMDDYKNRIDYINYSEVSL